MDGESRKYHDSYCEIYQQKLEYKSNSIGQVGSVPEIPRTTLVYARSKVGKCFNDVTIFGDAT
jgi:hypothetical protein